MFAQAVGSGSRLLSVSGSPRPTSVEVWAVREPSGRTEVVVINDGARRWDIAVRPPRSVADGTLELLRAPSLGASHGVSIGGQSFEPQTSTGQLTGVPKLTLVKPMNQEYQVRVPPASAVLLTVP